MLGARFSGARAAVPAPQTGDYRGTQYDKNNQENEQKLGETDLHEMILSSGQMPFRVIMYYSSIAQSVRKSEQARRLVRAGESSGSA